MKQHIRKIVFWTHLTAGCLAGLVILVMSATGAVMAFQPQLLDWAESDSRRVSVPSGSAARMTPDQILERARGGGSGAAPTSMTIYADREAAVRVTLGREAGVFVDPYTGEVRPLAGRR